MVRQETSGHPRRGVQKSAAADYRIPIRVRHGNSSSLRALADHISVRFIGDFVLLTAAQTAAEKNQNNPLDNS